MTERARLLCALALLVAVAIPAGATGPGCPYGQDTCPAHPMPAHPLCLGQVTCVGLEGCITFGGTHVITSICWWPGQGGDPGICNSYRGQDGWDNQCLTARSLEAS